MRGIVVAVMFLVMAASVSAYITIDHWGIYEDELYDEYIDNEVQLDITGTHHDDSIKVIFSIPELGVVHSKGPYDPSESRYTGFLDTVWLPSDAEYGEYVVRMEITDSEGNRRIKHRFIDIDQP